MKYLHTLLLGILIAVSPAAQAQCESEEFMDNCAALLNDYLFIKAFNVDESMVKDGKVEYSYVFSKGTSYLITICDQNLEGKKMIVTLYDRNRKKVATSYYRPSQKHFPKILYPCQATGVYYMEYTFEDEPVCGVSILGFKK